MVVYAPFSMVQLPHVPHVPIRYSVCGWFVPNSRLAESSNWVTFTYGQTRYVYSGRAKSSPQKHSPRSSCTAAGPKRMSGVHTFTRLTDTVGEGVGVEVPLAVPEREDVPAGEEVRVPLGDLVGLRVGERVDCEVCDREVDTDAEAEEEEVPDTLPLPLGVSEGDDEAEGDSVVGGVWEGVPDDDGVPVGVAVIAGVPDALGETDEVDELDADADAEDVADEVNEREPVALTEPEDEEVVEGEPVAVAELEGDDVADDVDAPELDADGVAVTAGDAVELAAGVADWLPDSDGETEVEPVVDRLPDFE